MAPEQANGESEKIPPATDIWALGLVTLRLLTGEHLWGSPSMPELIKNIVVAPIPKPSERWPSDKIISPSLDAWFARSCDRDPGKRWSSVEDQMRSLQDALAIDPLALADTRPSGSLAVERPKMEVTASGGARPDSLATVAVGAGDRRFRVFSHRHRISFAR